MKTILRESVAATGFYLAGMAVYLAFTGSLWTARDLLGLLVGGGVFFVLYSCFLWVEEKLWGAGQA